MQTIEVGDQYEHESVGRVEVQSIKVKSSAVVFDENETVQNAESLVADGTVYVRMYCYVSGMPGEEELSTFVENVEPYEDNN